MRKITFVEDEFYHIYDRGVDKRAIFISQEDYDRFEAYLYILNDENSTRAANYFKRKNRDSIFTSYRDKQLVAIGAYCLMPNHFHLLLTPLVEGGVSKFMQKLLTGYSMYFNEKYSRRGALFESSFKAKHADNDNYLKYLFAYIHLNPSKLFTPNWQECNVLELEELARKIMDYRYSSMSEYLQSKPIITSPKQFPQYFARAKDVETYVRFWMRHKDDNTGLDTDY